MATVFIQFYLKKNYPNLCRFQIYNSYKKMYHKLVTAHHPFIKTFLMINQNFSFNRRIIRKIQTLF